MSQVRKGHAAYVGNPGTPVSEWKEIGYVSEDGIPAHWGRQDAGEGLVDSVTWRPEDQEPVVNYFDWPRVPASTSRRLLNEVDAGVRALRNQQMFEHWGFDLSTTRPAPRTKRDLIWGPDVPVSLKRVSIR